MNEVQLNTLYVVTEGAYLHRDGQTVVIEVEKKVAARVPLHLLDSIACFGRMMVSPGLMEACAEAQIPISFLSSQGRMLARVDAVGGGVQLRRHHFRKADDAGFRLGFARAVVAGKVQNSRHNLLRSARDIDDAAAGESLRRGATLLEHNLESASRAATLEELRGIEGDAARIYFEHFAMMTPGAELRLRFVRRSRQPPLDPINALLSLFYSILTNDCAAALSSAGLDPAVGFFHDERPGRPSLALDLVEEFRAYLADRFVITLINRKQVTENDFVERPGGAVELTDPARRRLIAAFQERKQERKLHPYLEQEAPLGRFPSLQARILARHIRGDLAHYVPLIVK